MYVHPNVFLRAFWQMDLRAEVFVAMTFADEYRTRYDDVIAPAVRSVSVGGVALEPRRVDESRSGDSILTEIMDGIAHSQMVLADVSTVGKDSKSGRPYRNGNVMYEVGIALACRQPQEVLLVRDDQDPFLFDVSTIPHMTLDFSDVTAARVTLAQELLTRLDERRLVYDARVRMAIGRLSDHERKLLLRIKEMGKRTFWWVDTGFSRAFRDAAVSRLLDKQLVRAAGQSEDGNVAYTLTPLGDAVMGLVASRLATYVDDSLPTPQATDQCGASVADTEDGSRLTEPEEQIHGPAE